MVAVATVKSIKTETQYGKEQTQGGLDWINRSFSWFELNYIQIISL